MGPARALPPGLVQVAVLGLGLIAVLGPTHAAAQGWRLEAHVGRLDHEVGGATASTTSTVLGLSHAGRQSLFRVSSGLPLSSGDAVWGSVGAWRRLTMDAGPWSFGTDLTGHGFGQRAPAGQDGLLDPFGTSGVTAWGAAGQVAPLVGLTLPRVAAEARGGVSVFHQTVGDAAVDRGVPFADARITVMPGTAWALAAEVLGVDAPEGRHALAGLTLQAASGPVDAWGSVGRWLADTLSSPQWAAGLTLFRQERVSVQASVRNDVFDPFFETPPRTTWSVGASVRLGRMPPRGRPVPARYDDGRATIELTVSAAPAGVRIAGDFNDWRPEPMTRQGDRWTYTTALDPGVYQYSFVHESGEWFVPDDRPGRRDDGMGGHVAVLVVQ